MADVAVSVHRDPRDVKNGSDDTETHEETADLKKKRHGLVRVGMFQMLG